MLLKSSILKPIWVVLIVAGIVMAVRDSLDHRAANAQQPDNRPPAGARTPADAVADATAPLTIRVAFVLAPSDVVPPRMQRDLFARAAAPFFAVRSAQFRLADAPEGRLMIAEFFSGFYQARGVPSLSRDELRKRAADAINAWLADLDAIARAAQRQEMTELKRIREQKLADAQAEHTAAEQAARMLAERIEAIGDHDTPAWGQMLHDAQQRALRRLLDAAAHVAELSAPLEPFIIVRSIHPELVLEHGDGREIAPHLVPEAPPTPSNPDPGTGTGTGNE